MAEKATVAVIGCGGVASYAHLPALARIDNVKIVGLCDTAEDRANALAQRFGGKPFTDYQTMLADLRPQRVHVLTPDTVHVQPALAALEAGADVLIEKPLAETVEGCRRLASQPGRSLIGVGYNYRFIPVMVKAYEQLRSGTIGDLVGLTCFCHNFCFQHCIDLARWLAGPVVRVRAEEGRRWSERPEAPLPAVPEHRPTVMFGHPMVAALQLEHSHGAISQIVSTSQLDLSDVMFEMRLIGTDGWLRIDQVGSEDVVGRLRKFSAAHDQSNVPPDARGELVEFFPGSTGGLPISFEASIRAFHRAADSRTSPPVDVRAGLEVVAIESAGRRSADEGRAVMLSEVG